MVFCLANAAFFPATILSVACGFLLPLHIAIPIAMVCRSLTAFGCSFLSRYFLRTRWQTWSNPLGPAARTFEVMSLEGIKGVILLRLSPAFPSGPSNYLLGLTTIPLPSIFAGTMLGTFPNTLLCTLAGAGLGTWAEIRGFRWTDSEGGFLLLGLGVGATVLLIWQVRRRWVKRSDPKP